ncbi:MAG: acetyl-CoA carboxylase biotin carboxyl carrier protein [Rhodospirillales bacterium]|nr:acetyl-CoA carboxylase biotin carboxyl carrier protein [Alphaproteobacteria bacterium]MCB9986449.1 acetyl-CoA carboxylase biotin carboxyl carrier protein [Rhodospirillales bacterium]USO07005.1 MAG: acetyl-CoA carboxylase biotin carboxyl carrier protein [Rhodospirillales bacterium]
MKIDKAAIRQLAELLDETALSEIEVAQGEEKIRVSRRAEGGIAYMPPMASAGASVFPIDNPGAPMPPSMEIAHATTAQHPGAVISPMVGTAYLSPEPGKPPFVAKGAQVKAGDTLMIIEAMKVMNPIKAERGGTVKQVLIEDARPVEFGDVLMIIE